MPLEYPTAVAAEYLAKFKAKIIEHPHLLHARDEVFQFIEEPAGASLAAVIGPTGAGKSTLVDRVRKTVFRQHEAAMAANTALVPIVSVEAPAPELGKFNWRDFYQRILMELKEPACDFHMALQQKPTGNPGVARLSSLQLPDLRARVEVGFRHRGVKVLLIDEAQHLFKMTNSRRMHDQMDALKSLASLSKAFFVLFGTYELIPLLELNGQLGRRCVMVHLPRYRCDVPTEWQDYQKAIRTLEQLIVLPSPPELLRYSEFLYLGSAGCVGILKDWLTDAYSRTLKTENQRLTKAILEASRRPESTLRKIAEEAAFGETQWARSHAPDHRLAELLGLPLHPPAELGSERSLLPSCRKPPVGIRNPIRDPIGVEAALV